MLLEGVVVKVLDTVGEVGPGDAEVARSGKVVLDPDLALLRAEATGDPVELGVAVDPRVVATEVPAWLTFCTETYSTLAPSSTKISTAAFR